MEVKNLEEMVSGLLFIAVNVALAGVYITGMIKYHKRESRKTTEATYKLTTR